VDRQDEQFRGRFFQAGLAGAFLARLAGNRILSKHLSV